MTAIITLNWHGADDTLALLQSLSKAEGEFVTYVVDNGSTDDSVARLQQWIDHHPGMDVRLIALDKNYGFARGNNKGLEIARQEHYDSYLLLNNDTEVLPDFLLRLRDFAQSHPECRVLTPKINYHYDKSRVWNCGGKLTFGFRKYYYAGAPDSAVSETEYIPISFVTGCALYFYPELLDAEGHLLTERFFFGEEDFEFSLRMRSQHISMACVLDSLIYHKVGASGDKMHSLGKLYMHYLNRSIDVRLHFRALPFFVWQQLNMPFALRYFYRSTRSLSLTLKLYKQLLRDTKHKCEVTQEDFNRLVIERNYFTFPV